MMMSAGYERYRHRAWPMIPMGREVWIKKVGFHPDAKAAEEMKCDFPDDPLPLSGVKMVLIYSAGCNTSRLGRHRVENHLIGEHVAEGDDIPSAQENTSRRMPDRNADPPLLSKVSLIQPCPLR